MSLIFNNTGLGTVTLKAGATGTTTFTFPTTNGSNGQVLTTDGTGVLSWAGVSTTLAGLSDVNASTPSNGDFLTYDSGTSKWVNTAVTPSTIGAQPASATLTALAAYNTNGFMVQTGPNTFVGRSIAGTAGRIGVTNGTGSGGNVAIDLATITQTTGGSMQKFTIDAFGRVTATDTVTSTDITTALGYTPVDKAGDTMTGPLVLSGDPTLPLHATTKQYVDSVAQGIVAKAAVRVATTADIVLDNTTTVIDTITLADGDRVLVKDQTAPEQNGIYIASTTGAWTRSTDMDVWSEVPGAFTFVQEGTTNANSGWVSNSAETGTIDTTPITFTQFSNAGSYAAGTGLVLTGNVFSLQSGIVTPGTYVSVQVDTYGRTVTGTTTQSWSTIIDTPISLSGYGIQDQLTVTGDVAGGPTDLADGAITLTLATVNGSPQTDQFRKITVNGKGLVTATSAVSSSDITTVLGFTPVTNARTITAGTGLTGGGDLTANRTINLADTAVSPNAYGDATNVATFTVDQQGRLTAASNVAITFPVTQVNGQTGNVTLAKADVGLANVDNSLQIINAGNFPSGRQDVAANLGSATGLTGQLFLATDTLALYRSNGTTWDLISSGTSSGTVTDVTLTQPTAGFTVTNSGTPQTVSASFTFALNDDLAAIEGLSGTGIAVRTAANTWTNRSLATASTARITVTNGDGVAGNPTVDLATLADGGTGTFLKVARDTYGRVSGTTAVVASDITTLVDSTYVNVTGDTMTGNLVMQAGTHITLTDDPVTGTDAVNKNYVDAAITGLAWKNSVRVLADTNQDIATGGLLTIHGVTLVDGDRILLTGQTTNTENGIYLAHSGSWTRSSDMDASGEFPGAAVFVTNEDNTFGNTGWVCTVPMSFTLGTDPVTFVQFNGSSSYTAGVGLSLTGNTFDVNLGAGIVQLPTDEVGIDLYDSANNPLILTTDGSTRDTASGTQLALLLDGSSLSKSTTGLKIADNVVLPGTGAMTVVSGNTGQRPAGSAGQMRYNSTSGTFEVYTTAWNDLVTDNVNAPSLSSLTNGTAANTISSGGNQQTWQWQLTTDSTSGLIISENSASTNGTDGNQYLFDVATTTSSTAGALRVVSGNTTSIDVRPDSRILLHTADDAAGGIGVNVGSTDNVIPYSISQGINDASPILTGQYVLTANTTDGTATEMFVTGSQRLVLKNNSTWKFEVHVAARRTDTTDESAGWKYEGVIDRQGTAATTALVGSVLETIVARDDTAWTVTISADTGNGSLKVAVTGEAAKTIKWFAFVRTVEVVN